VTLRGRLTAAFLAVVLGPILLGALFVGATVTAVERERSLERLALAATSVRTSMSALCQQLHAAADAVAVVVDPAGRTAVAGQVVARGLAAGITVEDPTGRPVIQTPAPPPRPWAGCNQGSPPAPDSRALAVRVEMRDAFGGLLGVVWAAVPVDAALVDRLAAATGAGVTVDDIASTEPAGDVEPILTATASGRVVQVDSRYAQRLSQPLPLVLSVPGGPPRGLYLLLVAAVLLAAVAAVASAWVLARSTTRPLAELGQAADAVAAGDLEARVPVRGRDEVGRLAAAFNRMTRETQAYVQALTASRDQLRGHLAVLGDTLSSTHDLQRILQVILETALAATGARAGAVLLLDPATGTLVSQCVEGIEEQGTLRVPVGSGLLGAVAATGVPLRGRVDRDGPALSPHEPRCTTYVAVPFAVPRPVGESPAEPAIPRQPAGLWPAALPTALGVLALYDRLGSDEFDDADLITLRTFAGQAAVAVDNVRVHKEAQRLSLTDPLTGLWNYRYLRESIRREVERANRFGRMLAVLALDLDRFKEVNDSHGHGAGDAVLVEFARRIRAETREVDLAFRQGGEEFVVLLPETDARGGATVAERLGTAVREAPILLETAGGETVRVDLTVSIGIAVYPDHGPSGQAVLDAADDALYAAKAAGRDGYQLAGVHTEIAVPAGGSPPDDGLPRAGADRESSRNGAGSGASTGAQPPRQSRGG
jgi:two-component system, cell cycle response regulator